MQSILTVAQWLVRISGVLLLLMGLLIWTENMRDLINYHMLLGLILVISLWVLALLSVRYGVPIGLAAGVAALGLLALWLGMVQVSLLPGPYHWVIQVVHLLVGMLTVGSGEAIGGRLRRIRMASA
jgi:hypothetical protein